MLKVWIVGSEGQIGEAINEVLDPLEIEVLNTDKNALDITETDEVLHFGEINRPDVIINCTGITDTDECEKNPEHASEDVTGDGIFCFRNGRICVRTVYFFYEGGNRLSHTWIYA